MAGTHSGNPRLGCESPRLIQNSVPAHRTGETKIRPLTSLLAEPLADGGVVGSPAELPEEGLLMVQSRSARRRVVGYGFTANTRDVGRTCLQHDRFQTSREVLSLSLFVDMFQFTTLKILNLNISSVVNMNSCFFG